MFKINLMNKEVEILRKILHLYIFYVLISRTLQSRLCSVLSSASVVIYSQQSVHVENVHKNLWIETHLFTETVLVC